MEGKKKERDKQGFLTKKRKEKRNTKAYQGLITVLCPQAT